LATQASVFNTCGFMAVKKNLMLLINKINYSKETYYANLGKSNQEIAAFSRLPSITRFWVQEVEATMLLFKFMVIL
jgi:hypothetical protein